MFPVPMFVPGAPGALRALKATKRPFGDSLAVKASLATFVPVAERLAQVVVPAFQT